MNHNLDVPRGAHRLAAFGYIWVVVSLATVGVYWRWSEVVLWNASGARSFSAVAMIFLLWLVFDVPRAVRKSVSVGVALYSFTMYFAVAHEFSSSGVEIVLSFLIPLSIGSYAEIRWLRTRDPEVCDDAKIWKHLRSNESREKKFLSMVNELADELESGSTVGFPDWEDARRIREFVAILNGDRPVSWEEELNRLSIENPSTHQRLRRRLERVV